jgi:hypothetical protein
MYVYCFVCCLHRMLLCVVHRALLTDKCADFGDRTSVVVCGVGGTRNCGMVAWAFITPIFGVSAGRSSGICVGVWFLFVVALSESYGSASWISPTTSRL